MFQLQSDIPSDRPVDIAANYPLSEKAGARGTPLFLGICDIHENDDGGTTQNRTGDQGVAVPRLTAWLWYQISSYIVYLVWAHLSIKISNDILNAIFSGQKGLPSTVNCVILIKYSEYLKKCDEQEK